ncbi:sugar ABC transporter substrate-binding protein [Arthrobacter alpinus]|uniref:ABC transporter substrate-binding protein n=1 Tax=Arthrobacter alpinus TaxID=656366 RepID=UPI0006793B98|nr:sugar ABC transporter substrate-binding protein [Arthrobacter alpinus]ALV46370.1 sugar ABC transporter substrate-binding protein [Arthrobacter alpinus]
MKRRNFLAAAVVLISTAGLTACSGAAGPAENPGAGAAGADGKTNLSIAVWNFAGTPEFKALFDAYEAANPNVKIEPIDILADDYPEKVTTMLAGGDTTDVLTMKNVIDYSRYSGRGQLLEVTDTVKSLDSTNTAGLETFAQDGKYFAIPYRQDFWLLYYNKGIFDAAGEKYPEQMTWEQYNALAKKLTTKKDGKPVYGTYHHTWRSVIQATASAQNDGDLVSGDYGFMKKMYENALDLQNAGAALDFGTAKSQQTGYRSMFETGQTAMMPMGTWYISGIAQAHKSGASDVEWGLAPMPQNSATGDVTTFGSPTAFAVNKNAKSADEAVKFLAWAAGADGAKAITAIGVVPALQGDAITEAYFKLEGMPTDDVSKAAFLPKTVKLEMPVSEFASDVDAILNEEHELVMIKDHSIEDGIAAMDKRVKSEVLN